MILKKKKLELIDIMISGSKPDSVFVTGLTDGQIVLLEQADEVDKKVVKATKSTETKESPNKEKENIKAKPSKLTNVSKEETPERGHMFSTYVSVYPRDIEYGID